LLLSNQLVATAKLRIESPTRITEADLRRAHSDLYYALFHRICQEVASSVPLRSDFSASRDVYVALYRSIEHGTIEKQCRDKIIDRFGPALTKFAQQFVTFKDMRERADYDPLEKFEISALRTAIAIAESVLSQFDGCDETERRSFAFYLAFRLSPRPTP